MLPVDEDLRLINDLLVSAPAVLAAPPGCSSVVGVVERQRKTAGDMLIRAQYVAEELHRQGGPGEAAGQALESGMLALRTFIDRLKSVPTVPTPTKAAVPTLTTAPSRPPVPAVGEKAPSVSTKAATPGEKAPSVSAKAATPGDKPSTVGAKAATSSTTSESEGARASGGASSASGIQSQPMDAFLMSLQGDSDDGRC